MVSPAHGVESFEKLEVKWWLLLQSGQEFLCCLRISENFSEGDLDHIWQIDSVPVPECGNGSSCLLPLPPTLLQNMIIIKEI